MSAQPENSPVLSFDDAELRDVKRGLTRGRRYRAQQRGTLALREFEAVMSACPHGRNPGLHNAALNEIELTQGAAKLESKPRALGVTLTNRCNIQCIMCSVRHDPWDIPEKTLREIEDLFPYLSRIMWQGGEVFMSPHFEALFDGALAYPGLQQHITTNGLLLTPPWARKLARANVCLTISIDGVTAPTFERIRRGGKFERLLEAVKNLNGERDAFLAETRRGSPLWMTMNVVVMRSNYRELERFVDFASEHGFEDLQINPVDFKGPDPEDIFRAQDQEALAHIEAVVPKMRQRARELGVKLHVWLPSRSKPELIRAPGCDSGRQPGAEPQASGALRCYWPWQHLFMDMGGRIRPHCFCGIDVGNVRTHSILELWNSEAMQTYRRRLHAHAASGWCSNRCVECRIEESALKLCC